MILFRPQQVLKYNQTRGTALPQLKIQQRLFKLLDENICPHLFWQVGCILLTHMGTPAASLDL